MSQNNNDIQQQFKSIVNKLPEDKKKALYKRLKEMDSETRNKTIAAIVEKDREAKANNKSAPSEVKTDNKKKTPAKTNKAAQQRPSNNTKNKPQQKSRPADNRQGKNNQVKRNSEQHSDQVKKPVQKQAQKPVQKQVKKPAEKKPVQKQVPKTEVKKPEQEKPVIIEEKETETVTAKKPKNKGRIIAVAASLTAVAALGVLAYINRESIKQLFVSNNTAETTSITETTGSASQPETTAASTETQTTQAPTASPSPAPSSVPLAPDAPNLKGMTVVIDPGHQKITSSRVEKVASWMAAEKSRCTSGGVGVTTGITEYELTLDFGNKLKSYLEQCGANVIMTRSENDVDLSNQERANMATSSNCNLFLRIHADSANDAQTKGIQMYVPTQGKNFKGDISKANALGNALSEVTGLTYNGVLSTEVYTGLNYATTVHSVQVSLGYLSNSDDEAIITNEEMQYNMVVCFAKFCAEFK